MSYWIEMDVIYSRIYILSAKVKDEMQAGKRPYPSCYRYMFLLREKMDPVTLAGLFKYNPIKLDVFRCVPCYLHLMTPTTCYE